MESRDISYVSRHVYSGFSLGSVSTHACLVLALCRTSMSRNWLCLMTVSLSVLAQCPFCAKRMIWVFWCWSYAYSITIYLLTVDFGQHNFILRYVTYLLFTFVPRPLLHTCLGSLERFHNASVSSQPNLKCLSSSSYVLTTVTWQMSLSEKNVFTPPLTQTLKETAYTGHMKDRKRNNHWTIWNDFNFAISVQRLPPNI